MRNRLLVLLLFCLLTGSLFAQNAPSRFSLQATVTDTVGTKLNGATVMLQTAKDSILSNYGRTNEAGTFTLKGIRRGSYLLKITYVGMMPISQTIRFDSVATVDLGTVKLKPIAKELYEVVIKTARAPLTIRGDTTEYDIRAFKVPPGSTVEDLLKKLPGVNVDREGNIRAQGQEVKRVTVDGKQFFGDDPKMATKNLQADAISKVQVFSDKSEKAKLTGIDDGTKEKTLNLELKEEFKKGGFGKITAGAGPATGLSPRGTLRGNYNKFDKKQQLSAVGLVNNINQQGLSWDDYQDFKGSNSFNRNDEADFGFSGGGGYYFFSGSDDESLTIPVGGGRRGGGLSSNAAGGVNYNYDTKKTKFSSSYYGSSSSFLTDSRLRRQNFYQGGSVVTYDTTNQRTNSMSHRVSLRYDKELDSTNSLVIIHNSRLTNNAQNLLSTKELLRNDLIRTTFTNNTNTNNEQSSAMANTVLFRHKFEKKGRNFAASASYNLNHNDNLLKLRADLQFFEALDMNTQIRLLRQYQDQTTNGNVAQYKGNLQFTEPISKKFFLETFYNFALRYDEANRDVLNVADQQGVRIDSLSRYYTNRYTYNRLGTSFRYAHKGINIGLGGAVQRFTLNGEYAFSQNATARQVIDRTFTTFIPNLSLNFDLKNNKYAYGGYNMGVQIPSSRDLQPLVDNSNPLYISRGNPDLLPAITHNTNLGMSYFNPGSFINIYGSLNYNYNINQIVYAQTIDPKTLTTSTIPQNISGGQGGGFYTNVSFPLKKTKATMDIGGNLFVSKYFTPINGEINQTNSTNYNIRLNLALTPAEWLSFYAGANISVGNTRYSLTSSQNQQIFNNNFNADATVKLPGDIFVSSIFAYTMYRNDRFGFNQNVPIWNAAVYRVIGKAKKMEVRASAFDMLNRNIGVNQNAGQNSSSVERIRTLSRYFLLSFTYNMRGVTAKVRRNDSW